MIVIIYTYTKLIKINPLRLRLRQISPVVNWPRETSSLVSDKRRDEKRQTHGGNPCGMKVKCVYLRKCFMVSDFLLAAPETSRIIYVVNVGRGRLKRAAQAAIQHPLAAPEHRSCPPWCTEKAPTGRWLSPVQAALVLQDPDRHSRTFMSPCADTSRINARITARSSPVWLKGAEKRGGRESWRLRVPVRLGGLRAGPGSCRAGGASGRSGYL